MGLKKSSYIQAEITNLFQQFDNYKNKPLWLIEYLKDIEQQYKKLSFTPTTYREKRRIEQYCNSGLRDFHQICINSYCNAHATSTCPDWMLWKSGKGADFYEQLLINFKTLDAKTLHIISLSIPKTLSSYEEDIHTLRVLETSSISHADYQQLLKILASLKGNWRLFE